MKENKLIASVVVFKELFDNNKDVYDIISEFLKAAILDRKKWNFTSTECKSLLEDVFDFKIPEAVVKTALKNRLVKSGFLSFQKGSYSVLKQGEELDTTFETVFKSKKEIYRKTEDEFIDFIAEKRGKDLQEKDREKIRENISHYLLGNGINEPFTKEISEYIIQKKSDSEFSTRLNHVKEGVVLYTGVRYTADLNDLGTWNEPLTIFLDTEIIFNYLGYNGEVYQEIIQDYLKLVREVNQKSQKRNKKRLIELRYFDEIEQEIINFFHVAGLIIEGKMPLDPSKTAMKEITNGCSTKSDILVKRNKLFIDLKTSGIHKEEQQEYYENHAFNVEGTEILKELSIQAKKNRNEFDEEYCKNYLKLFTKINVLRRGKNNLGFEKCRYIILTGNGFIRYLAHHDGIKENEKDIPFATDIDFITDKFWFKLKKGFGGSEDVPKSFDMITKAQMVLASQIKDTVQEKFTALNEKFKNGEISKEEAISLTYELRENSLKPEDLTEENITHCISFITDFSLEKHIQERELLNQKVLEGEIAKKELKRRVLLERTSKTKKIKTKIRIAKLFYSSSALLLLIILYGVGFYLIQIYRQPEDTFLSLIGLILGLVALFPFWKYQLKFHYILKSRLLIQYKTILLQSEDLWV